jgi:hypothetical protein
MSRDSVLKLNVPLGCLYEMDFVEQKLNSSTGAFARFRSEHLSELPPVTHLIYTSVLLFPPFLSLHQPLVMNRTGLRISSTMVAHNQSAGHVTFRPFSKPENPEAPYLSVQSDKVNGGKTFVGAHGLCCDIWLASPCDRSGMSSPTSQLLPP